MIVVGFVAFIVLGIALLVWMEVDFYFGRSIKGEKNVFGVLISFAKDHTVRLILALVSIVVGMIFGLL